MPAGRKYSLRKQDKYTPYWLSVTDVMSENDPVDEGEDDLVKMELDRGERFSGDPRYVARGWRYIEGVFPLENNWNIQVSRTPLPRIIKAHTSKNGFSMTVEIVSCTVIVLYKENRFG